MHLEFDFVIPSGLRRAVFGDNPQSSEGPAPVKKQKRAGKLPAMVSLFVLKIVRSEQLAGGVMQAIGVGRADQGIGRNAHGETVRDESIGWGPVPGQVQESVLVEWELVG